MGGQDEEEVDESCALPSPIAAISPLAQPTYDAKPSRYQGAWSLESLQQVGAAKDV